MKRNTIERILFSMVSLGGLTGSAWAAALPGPIEETTQSGQAAAPVEVFRIPPGTVFEKVFVGPNGATAGGAAVDNERLIYSNTLGAEVVRFGANKLVADDISTNAPNGCKLRRYEFQVSGKVVATDAGGAYTVDFALYDNCPQAVTPTQRLHYTDEPSPDTGIKLRGADGQITFADDAPRTISFVVPDDQVVPIPTNLWLGVKFDRANCGVVVGAPASMGFSADAWDFPGFPCNGNLGGFPWGAHASFWTEVYGGADCPNTFLGYRASQAAGPKYSAGTNAPFYDDIKLIVNNCLMTGYEVAVRGQGYYTFGLYRDCIDSPSSLIPGTDRTFNVGLSTTPQLQLARFSFDPPIQLPDSTAQPLYFRFTVNNLTNGGVVMAGIQPTIGSSGESYFIIDPQTQACAPQLPPPPLTGVFHASITCGGSPPVGACCDMAITQCIGGPDDGKPCPCSRVCRGASYSWCCSTGSDCDTGTCEPYCTPPGTCESVCREVPQMNCPWPWPPNSPWGHPQPAWVEGATCESNPFPHICGQSVCCMPNDTCENLTENECLAQVAPGEPILWQRGGYCEDSAQYCPFYACLGPGGNCNELHDDVGCNDPNCCQSVCTLDLWCCHVEWDRLCVEHAMELCPYPPTNDVCVPDPRARLAGATELTNSVPSYGSNELATEDWYDSGFCCNANAPGATGYGSVWFKFVATDESVQIDTCASDPASDSLVNVFSVGDPTSEVTACQSLSLIGCGDNDGCPNSEKHSRFCVDSLTPGVTYYIMLASKTPETKGTYQIELKSPCQYLVPFPSGDCNHNGALDGCDLADNTSVDCNLNGILDECEIAAGTGSDCDANGFLDECSGAVATFRPPSPAINGGFGHSLDMQGEWLVIGTSDFYTTPTGGDNLYIYRRTGGGWAKAAEFFLPDAPAYVDLDGDWIVASSDHDSVAHLFHFDGTEWSPAGSLQGPEVLPCPRYGFPVAVHGDVIALGKGFCLSGWAALPEEVYIFRFDGVQWIENVRIQAPDPSRAGGFGASVSLDGDRLLVGAPYTSSQRGAAYIFRRVGEVWVREATLTPTAESGYFFGQASVLKGDMAFVGGFQYSPVYLFRRSNSSWAQDAMITRFGDWDFGWSIRVAENTLAVGATSASGDGLGEPGAVYIFSRRGSQWIETAKLVPPDYFAADCFGHGLATDGSLVAVGAPATQWQSLANAGTAYVYQPPQDCNGNGIRDLCEIRDGTAQDCNADGAPDDCDIADGASLDCQPNGIPDECELADGTSADCNGNSIPDECEPQADCNANGIQDICDIAAGLSTDCNLNLVPDECENPTDCNNNGRNDLCDLAAGAPDCNRNGIPDECDIHAGTSLDCNTNRVPDECDIAGGRSRDCQPNGIPDECDIADNAGADCNRNSIPDDCELAAGTGSDCDGNGILDECSGVVATFRPPSPAINGGFGHSLDMQGEWLVIGTSDFYVTPTGGDNLYIYGRAGAGWTKTAEFFLPDAPAYVDLDGDWIVASSDHDSVAYLFHFDGTKWSPAGSLQGPDVLPCARYGYPVAVHADVIALGKGFCQDGVRASPEEVYIFRFDGTQWMEEARIEAPGTSWAGGFGGSVSLDGDRLLVGAPYRYAAYIFHRVGEVWMHEATLTPPPEQSDNFFGRSSVLHGDLAFVGATLDEDPHGQLRGAVYLFRRSGSSWTQEGKLTASDGFGAQYFGWSVRVAGNTLAVGVTTLDRPGVGWPGSVYVFSRRGLQWIETARLVPPGAIVADSFGNGVATDGSLVAVGAPATQWHSLANAGTAYVYQQPQDCNGNDIRDFCDIRDGTALDCNADGVPDDCEPRTFGDFDFDGRVDLRDFAALQRCFTGTVGQIAPCCAIFDLEPRDGNVDLSDAAAFSAAMTEP